jgi:diguanylate cyclase (GGDEF)-like protein
MDEEKLSDSVLLPRATAEKLGETLLEKVLDKVLDYLFLIAGPLLLGLLAYFHKLLPRPITLPLWQTLLLFGGGGAGFGAGFSFWINRRTLNRRHQERVGQLQEAFDNQLGHQSRELASVREEFDHFRLHADKEAAALQRQLDIARRQLGEKAVEADTDEITGILNSRACQRQLREQFAEARRTEQPITIVIIDLDNFKTVNDQDRGLGDQILREFATNLRDECRRKEPVFRYKVGDEFLVLAANTEADPAGRGFANRLRNFFANYQYTNPRGGEDFRVTISAGVADANPSADLSATPERLLARAESALKKAKLKGKNTVEVYEVNEHDL